MRLRFIAVMVIGLMGAGLVRGDWPQFEGPSRTGLASGETHLARSWPTGGPTVLWTVNLGEGFGGPAIVDGQVFVLDRQGNEKDVLRVFDLASGKELWSTGYEAAGKLDYNGSRSTPTVDIQHVYTVGPFGQVTCFDRKTHQIIWQETLAQLGGKRPNWGISQSPLLVGDHLIVAPQGPEAGLAALDKNTGKVIWKSPGIGKPGYVSPILTEVDGKRQVVMVTTDRVVGVDPATGQILWTYGGFHCSIPIPAPTPLGDGKFFLTAGYNTGSMVFQVTPAGGQNRGYQVQELAKNKKTGSQVHPAILYRGYLYLGCRTNNFEHGLTCLDQQAQVKWQTDHNPAFDRGGYLLADGLLYVVGGQTGDLVLVDPQPTGYKELGRVHLLSGKNIWGPLAISGGKLIIRDQKQMKCVEVGTGN